MKNKKRVLITATTPYMIKSFLTGDFAILQELGYEVEIATNFQTFNVISEKELQKFKNYLENREIEINQIDFDRSVINLKSHIKSYKQMKKLMNTKQYQLIHTHTPISSLITRLAYKKSNIYDTCRMIYTAHGFHFFKGNNLIKNLIFRNIERFGAKYTDVLITINKEDYEAAKKFKLKKNGRVEYIPGVGIDIEKINSIQGNKEELCKELDISSDSFLLLSVGELNDNKNHKVVIETLPKLPNNIHYVVCGTGPLKEQFERLAKELHVEDRLHLLGYRSDVIRIMKSCNVFVFPSKREGLSVALMEAMVCGLPCIASNIRGNNDLIKNYYGGFLMNTKKIPFELAVFINKIKPQFGINNQQIMKEYDSKKIEEKMLNIYSNSEEDTSNIERKRIFFICGSMSKGGAERVLSNIANYLIDCDIYILTLLNFNSDYYLNSNVQIINLSKTGSYFKNVFYWVTNIRKTIRLYQPDTILSFAGRINILTIISNLGIKNNLVVSERNDPNNDGRSRSIIFLTNLLYNLADIVVFQTEYAKSIFSKKVQKKSLIIPNPIHPELSSISRNKIENKIVTVGRLEYQKNHKLLINAVSQLHEKYPAYVLEIYGKGTLEKELDTQIKELNAQSFIFLKGQIDVIYNCIKSAALFVLPSRFEGVSNALLEAMMLGIPCVTSNYPGSNEIITHNKNGYTFNNQDLYDLIRVIDFSLSNDNTKIVENAKDFMKKYDPEIVLEAWRKILVIERGRL